MNVGKNQVLVEILETLEEVADWDTDDSDKEEMMSELLDVCNITMDLSKKPRSTWIKFWRKPRLAMGSYAFLTNELMLGDEASYMNYLRMDKEKFHHILSFISSNIKKSDTIMRQAVRPAEKLALTLRFLATGESFQSLNYQTRLSTSFISMAVPKVCEAIYNNLKGTYLKFPSTANEWLQIAKQFALKRQFPNCLGALDGKHISFLAPKNEGAYFYNYKGTNSIVLLALADADYRFLYTDVGCNGRTNDAGVYLQSELEKFVDDGSIFPDDSSVGNGRILPYVILADDAFPMTRRILKPYPYHTNSSEKKIFNDRVSCARGVVEQAFGIMCGRFRVFLSTMNLHLCSVEHVAQASCVLHNYLLTHDLNYATSSTDDIQFANVVQSEEPPYNPRRGEAETIRQQFMNYFSQEGRIDRHTN